MFTSIPEGSYYVLAIAFPACDSPQAYLLPDRGVLLGMSQGCFAGQQDITLHMPRLTDPPIVSILPFL
jgi:hypothetical protein